MAYPKPTSKFRMGIHEMGPSSEGQLVGAETEDLFLRKYMLVSPTDAESQHNGDTTSDTSSVSTRLGETGPAVSQRHNTDSHSLNTNRNIHQSATNDNGIDNDLAVVLKQKAAENDRTGKSASNLSVLPKRQNPESSANGYGRQTKLIPLSAGHDADTRSHTQSISNGWNVEKADLPGVRGCPEGGTDAAGGSLHGRNMMCETDGVMAAAKTNYRKHGGTHQKDPSAVPKGSDSVKNGDSEGGTGNPDLPPRQPSGGGTGTARHKVQKSGGTLASSIPEEEIVIPGDGNLAAFSADAMATFLRYLRLEDRLVNHLHRNGLDGRKFGRLKDSDLDSLQLTNNPVLLFFRDKTAPAVTKKPKQRLPFVL